jgi:hypothetical protein
VNPALHELDRIERRVLGALRCVDATTRAGIETPFRVDVANAAIQRNRSGLYVIVAALGLADHASAFSTAPATPAAGSVRLTATITDPSGRYLPRLAALALPRDPLPSHRANSTSLFRPVEVAMYPSTIAPSGANWAVLNVSVAEKASGDALGGALLIVTSAAKTLARGLTDWRGEALLAIPGVPVTTWSNDPHAVVVSEIAVKVKIVFDPALGTRITGLTVAAGRLPVTLPTVDPDDLESRAAQLPNSSVSVSIAARRVQSLSSQLSLP